MRPKVVPGDPVDEIAQALSRYVGVRRIHPVPYDRGALDTAVASGRSLVEAAAGSPARKAISLLADELAGTGNRRLRGRRGNRRALS